MSTPFSTTLLKHLISSKKIVGTNSKKTKLSFTDSSIILTMKESNITDLVSFDQQFKNFNEINLIGPNYL